MTRKELLAAIAKHTGYHQEIVMNVTDSLFDFIAASLATGENVKIKNVGVFEARPRKAVERRNPRTGDMLKVPARMGFGFRPAPTFRRKVAGDA